MEALHAPWRIQYILGPKTPPGGGSIFARIAQSNEDEANYVIARGRTCFAMLNNYPYNGGHLMVVLKRHVGTLAATTPEEQTELMQLTRRAEIALTEAYTPQGINIGVNIGRPAGAGVLDHLHVHLVPRWNGDTNFMTVIGETRVLPEDLAQSAARLRPIFERLGRADA